ncbi:hypothetical protein [Azorhizophilus paspali]|uniref:Uncharacterized protein n=1 Tax=Azorhizophilus paspali TaxID=69963 RepID=A0ABV6SPV8_AZOPA
MSVLALANLLRRPRPSRPALPERLHFHLRKRLASASDPIELNVKLERVMNLVPVKLS